MGGSRGDWRVAVVFLVRPRRLSPYLVPDRSGSVATMAGRRDPGLSGKSRGDQLPIRCRDLPQFE